MVLEKLQLACQHEDIHPHRLARLPLLFAWDGQLAIEDSFVYTLDCRTAEAGLLSLRPICFVAVLGASRDPRQ